MKYTADDMTFSIASFDNEISGEIFVYGHQIQVLKNQPLSE